MRFLLPTFSLLLIFSLLHLPTVFPARTTPTVKTKLTIPTVDDSYNSTTWRDFAKFVDLEKGSHVTGISELKKYFHHFGYLHAPVNLTDEFDSYLESAVLNYQKNLGLPVTGKLDNETIHLIMSPRCGLGDFHSRAANTKLLHKTQRFAYFSGHPRWIEPSPVNLTYAFSQNHMIDYVSRDEIKAVFSRAFLRWSKVIPINFTEVEDYPTADIKIGFHKGDHGDGRPFDGVLGILAHAFSPENGRLHLDGAETWAVDFETQKSKVAVDLESVATHEIGHVLGLAHSTVKEAIMYPSLSPRTKKVDLRIDDVEGVQALYGSNPNFKFSSLIESEETSSNAGVGGLRRFNSWWAIFLGLALLMLL